jgi:hypothetical protein
MNDMKKNKVRVATNVTNLSPKDAPEIYFQRNGWGFDKYEITRNMNRFYAAVMYKEQMRVLHELADGSIEFLRRADFKAKHENHIVTIEDDEGKMKKTNAGKVWLESRGRRFFNSVVFTPNLPPDDEVLNLWTGFGIDPRPGPVQLFLDFVKDVICSGNEEHYQYLVAWLAQMFQDPTNKPGVAVVLRGEEGVGKSFFVEKICALMGKHFFKSSNPSHIYGAFNSQLMNKIILHQEEQMSGTKREEGKLRDLVTGHVMSINPKGLPAMVVPNYLHVFITGNPTWLVSTSSRARRYFALHVSEAHRRDTKYFGELHKAYNEGMNSALLHYLLNYDYSQVDLIDFPITEETIHQKVQSMTGVDEWWLNILQTGEMPSGKIYPDGTFEVIKRIMYDDYCKSKSWRRTNVKMNERSFGIKFKQLMPTIVDGIVQKHANGVVITVVQEAGKSPTDRGRENKYVLPSLKVCQELMEFNMEATGKMTWEKETWTIKR